MSSQHKEKIVDISCTLHAKSERAIFVSTDGYVENAVWLPLSQVEVSFFGTKEIIVTLPEWLAVEKKLDNDIE